MKKWMVVCSILLPFLLLLISYPVPAREVRPTSTLSPEVTLPPRLIVAIGVPGTLYNAIGTTIAKVISDWSRMPATPQSYAGPGVWNPLVAAGEVHLAPSDTLEARSSFLGREPLYLRASKDLRAIVGGIPLRLGFMVRKDSNIRTIADLRGRKVGGGFPTQIPVRMNAEAMLRNGGLTWNNVMEVKLGSAADIVPSFLEGRIDTASIALGSGLAQEPHARVGIRYLPLSSSPDALARMRQIFEGYYITVVRPEEAPEIDKPTPAVAYDLFLITSTRLSEAAVYEIVRVLWEYNEQMRGFHPALKQWTREKFVNNNMPIPYHEGAIKFFKDRNLWTDEAASVQVHRLAEAR